MSKHKSGHGEVSTGSATDQDPAFHAEGPNLQGSGQVEEEPVVVEVQIGKV